MNKLFISRFETALKQSNLKASELSKRSGVSESFISNYRAGRSVPSSENLIKLSNALGVSTAWLIGLEDQAVGGIESKWKRLTPGQRKTLEELIDLFLM